MTKAFIFQCLLDELLKQYVLYIFFSKFMYYPPRIQFPDCFLLSKNGIPLRIFFRDTPLHIQKK